MINVDDKEYIWEVRFMWMKKIRCVIICMMRTVYGKCGSCR